LIIGVAFLALVCDGRKYFFIESLIQNEALIIVVPLQVTSFILYLLFLLLAWVGHVGPTLVVLSSWVCLQSQLLTRCHVKSVVKVFEL
jgi:hypothetical protein